MATNYCSHQLFSVSKKSVSKIQEKEQRRKQALGQRVSLAHLLPGAVWLILTALFCALLLTDFIPCFHPTPDAWAQAGLTKTLTVASSNPNSGVSITVRPNDRNEHSNGTTPFTRTYNNNTVVTLTAPSTAGSNNFQKWQRNGVDYAFTNSTTVTMDADYTMTAVYVAPPPVTHRLTVASSNPNSGVSITVSPNDNGGQGNGTTQFFRTYNDNTVVTLTAPSTAGGNNFQKWQRNGVDYAFTAQTTVTMNANYTMTAVYVTPPPVTRTLTVTSSYPNSGVSITVSPNDNSSQGNGTTQFTRIYNNNTVVTLTAPSTAGGNNFQNWQRNGVDYVTTVQTTLTMDADYTMTAVYVKPPVTRTLTVTSSNPNSGVSITVSPNDNSSQGSGTTQFTRTYNNNTVVTLTATSNAGGNNFQNWQRNGVDYVSTIQTTVTMDADYTMTAIYVEPNRLTNFAVYAQEHLTIGKGSSISGGAVGAAMNAEMSVSKDLGMSGGGVQYRVEIMGARIDGDVYGDSVYLGRGSRVNTVFTNRLTNEKGKFQATALLPSNLPSVLPVNGGKLGGQAAGAVLIPSKSKKPTVLGHAQLEVHLGDGVTAILKGGRYEFETLELGIKSRLIVEDSSFLVVNRTLEVGEKSFVGPADNKLALNLTIVVMGADRNRSAAIFGKGSKIQAAVRVPKGTLELRDKVNAKGSYYASVVKIGEMVNIAVPAWEDSPEMDPQCLHRVCRAKGRQFICEIHASTGQPCDDGNACTGGNFCTSKGFCISAYPTPRPSGYDSCLRDTCDPATGWYKPLGTVCDTNVQCKEPTMCDGQGWCSILGAPFLPGTPCDLGNAPSFCAQGGICLNSFGQFDCLANNCSANADEPPDLECWMSQHPSIKGGFRWIVPKPDGSTTLFWDDWEGWRKQALQKAFEDAWNWYEGGMTNFQGTPIPEPPPNKAVLSDDDPPTTIFDEGTAWSLYLAHLAQSLLVEIKRLVPWSLCDYPYEPSLRVLFLGHSFYWVPEGVYPDLQLYMGVTPAHPTFTFSFMVQNDLIGQTRFETIARLLRWARRMHHNIGCGVVSHTKYNEYVWQYRGAPPVSKIIQGTIMDPVCSAPTTPKDLSGLQHWTAGCSGTTYFLQEVLRSVNIPVDYLGDPCYGHAQPYFPSEGLYLSHGDDLYYDNYTDSVPPAEELLIDQATYLNWFTSVDCDTCLNNVGRRGKELVLKYLPDPFVKNVYCNYDVILNKTHENSQVYGFFKNLYTLQELEAADLWGWLCQRATELGACNCQ